MFNSSLSCAMRCMAYSICACAAPGLAILQEPMWCTWRVSLLELLLHLDELFAVSGLVCFQELCAAPSCVCLQEPVLHLCVPVYKNFVRHLDMSAYKSQHSCTCRCSVYNFFGLFWNDMFVLFCSCSKHWNKPKQDEKFFFGFVKQSKKTTETDRVSVLFGWNRKYFGSFRGHPSLKAVGKSKFYRPLTLSHISKSCDLLIPLVVYWLSC